MGLLFVACLLLVGSVIGDCLLPACLGLVGLSGFVCGVLFGCFRVRLLGCLGWFGYCGFFVVCGAGFIWVLSSVMFLFVICLF